MKFLKMVLAGIVAGLVLSGIGLIVASIVLFSAVSGGETVEVKEKSVLKIDLSRPIGERNIEKPFGRFSSNPLQSSRESMGLIELRQTIRAAKDDENIEGLYLKLGFLSGGFAVMEELYEVLEEFKSSEKFIVVYAEYITEKAYFLASIADEIHLNPEGFIEFNGFSSERTYYTGALEKLDIQAEIFRVGDYKSAVEPYMVKEMSEASREQTKVFLEAIYEEYLAKISQGRKITPKQLRLIADSMLVRNPNDALKHKLITNISYIDEFETSLKKRLGLKDDEKINILSYSKYQDNLAAEEEAKETENKVAVLIANGEILGGEGNESRIGSKSFVKEIKKLREDEDVKAIVIRINSPGGSSTASDIMWREIMLTKEKKPVIASMSNVAASGGYYMAMPCDKIFALPTTITGSIGIFGILFSWDKFMEEKLGVTYDRVSTGAFSDLGNPNRIFREEDREIIQQMVNEGYETFTSKAAENRGMEKANLLKIAGGRVWAGEDAKKLGLVDEFGGLEDAVKFAAQKAELDEEDYNIAYYPRVKDKWEEITDLLEVKSLEEIVETNIDIPFIHTLWKSRNEQNFSIQARLPYDIEIN